MTDSHIKEVTEKIGFMFQRCCNMPNYKVVMYVKNPDNLKFLIDNIFLLVVEENYNSVNKIYKKENSYIAHFKNGSSFNFSVIDSVNVTGEHCHVMFVDNKIRENELRGIVPIIDVYESLDGCAMLNPKPIYLNLE